ncbi:hypothetical protein [Parapedobacter indicus]|uniref:DUF559 domain-containing protein n=1 Tax=Parapedobacter indicus TaxID=1477437 RepID=A0A1I3V0W3_9SPHI|nr:hypothetical protein [Parapedobacter indicus]PPK99009.1 hypothetical protein CLV26_11539 [Parapedobacter indicus]SFJ88752.1 hypothetical protein SAMN05444682_115138 [Parapedobacter indicus]
MKSNWGASLVKSLKQRGWQERNNTILPPNLAQVERTINFDVITHEKKTKRSKGVKTGWIDDTRNLKSKETQRDTFTMLILQELGLEVWPEFHFSTERRYRIDYAIPVASDGRVLKIAIEQEGGIWAKGNSGHSSGTGIKRDMDKNNLLQSSGWRLIRRTPSELITNETLELIKRML